MDFIQFRKKYSNYPFIKAQDVLASAAKATQPMRNQLTRWKKNGLLIQLRRGIYILNENDRKVFPSRFFFANQIIWPSYVSLESALGHYGLIPEAVKSVTSVTLKKTVRFNNKAGEYIYQHIKPEAFRGYHSFKDEAGLNVFIAEPEKAAVDFFYLNLGKFKRTTGDIFKDSYRFQNTEILNRKKIAIYARAFKNKKLEDVSREFCEFVKEEKND